MPYTPPSRSISRNTFLPILQSPSSGSTADDKTGNSSDSTDSNSKLNSNSITTPSSGNFNINKLDVNAIPLKSSHDESDLRQSAFHNFMNHQNDSFNNINSNSKSKFYLLDNNSESCESLCENIESSTINSFEKSTINNSIPNNISQIVESHISQINNNGNKNIEKNDDLKDDLTKFTTESTQSYSYTPVSVNSLTMRLNVLKRSLEILLENPEWLNTSLESFPDYNIHLNPLLSLSNNSNKKISYDNKIDSSKLKDFLKMEKNVSSSTLQNLLQTAINSDKNSSIITPPPLPESSNENIITPPSTQIFSARSNSISSNSSQVNNITINDDTLRDLREILALLDHYQKNTVDLSNDNNIQDKVINLHNLSLSNGDSIIDSKNLFLNNNTNNTNNTSKNYTANKRKNLLKIKIMHALATPFLEQCTNQTGVAGLPILKSTSSSIDISGMSTLNLGDLNKTMITTTNSANNFTTASNPSRQFHASSNAKTKSPKAVFTVSTESPWNILNANDLGLLMFGFSKSSIRKMNLLDLIASRSKDLIINRLHRNTALVFAGEIIAVKRENKSMAWTSVWAKRRDNLIILIFEQVVCEIIDMNIERKLKLNTDFIINSVSRQNKSLFEKDLNNINLGSVLPSLNSLLKNSEIGLFKDDDITSNEDSNTINKIRYFTLKRNDDSFVPCAVTSEYIPINPNSIESKDIRSLIRINLHSLPYIAGSIVISSKNYQVKSFNEAIVKNLFGTADLKNQSLDIILPDFTKLMKLALKENPNLSYQEGLVLPEHYFRKLDSWLRGSNNNEREELFSNCKGIKGRHNDGNSIIVDIQLHVSNNDLYVIWITFGRTFSNKYYEFKDDFVEDNDVIDNNSKNADGDDCDDSSSNHPNSDSMDSNNIPSQLKLLDHKNHHLDSDSQGSNSTNLSRSSSLHTINPSYPVSPATPKVIRMKSFTKLTPESNDDVVDLDKIKESQSNTTEQTPTKSSNFGMSTQRTCAEHLKEEEDEIAFLKKNSLYFPKIIGAEKRTKKYSDFKVLKNLGQGAYGKVVYAQYKKDPLYKDCVKAIFKERILVDTWVRDRQLGTVPSEIQILYALSKHPHANIMRIVDYFEDDNCYYLETLQHGSNEYGAVDLYDIIEVKKDMTEYEAKYIYFQIVAALNHMHSRGIVHRDIKDENIIVDKDYFVKLIDFGSAAWVKDGPFGVFVGTIDYAAPEVLNGQPYDGKSQDVWAMGILLYTLIFKENPFCSVDEILDGGVKFPQYSDVSPACMELIRKILITDINKRPTMQDIMNDPWLEGFS